MSLFHICHHNMKIILFLKSRITVAIVIQRVFLFCIFKTNRGQRLLPKHLEARSTGSCVLENMLPYAAGTEGRMADLCLLCAICTGRHMHWALCSFSVFFPREGKFHYSLFVGETSIVQTWEERASMSEKDSGEAVLSCAAHLS